MPLAVRLDAIVLARSLDVGRRRWRRRRSSTARAIGRPIVAWLIAASLLGLQDAAGDLVDDEDADDEDDDAGDDAASSRRPAAAASAARRADAAPRRRTGARPRAAAAHGRVARLGRPRGAARRHRAARPRQRSRRAGFVPHAAHRQHDLGTLGVALDLRAQPLHVHVDQPGVGRVPVAPHLLEQHLAGEHLARLAGQRDEQVELERGQRDRRALAASPGGPARR